MSTAVPAGAILFLKHRMLRLLNYIKARMSTVVSAGGFFVLQNTTLILLTLYKKTK